MRPETFHIQFAFPFPYGIGQTIPGLLFKMLLMHQIYGWPGIMPVNAVFFPDTIDFSFSSMFSYGALCGMYQYHRCWCRKSKLPVTPSEYVMVVILVTNKIMTPLFI